MRKVLLSTTHYLLDYTSSSEFYFAEKLIHNLALKTPEVEHCVLCGKCLNEMPKNVKLFQFHPGDGPKEPIYCDRYLIV